MSASASLGLQLVPDASSDVFDSSDDEVSQQPSLSPLTRVLNWLDAMTTKLEVHTLRVPA
jgi:hypothetical protein